MHQKLQAAVDSMALFQATYPSDACMVIIDEHEVVGYLPAKTFDLKTGVGTKVANFRGTVTEKALSQRRFLREEHGPELFGFAYIATAQPVVDGSKTIGVISAVISNDQVDQIRKVASDLSSSVEQMTATNLELSGASSDVASQLQQLVKFAENMDIEINNTNEIVHIVKDIAQKSRILGLNASIEAARSGEYGKGFAVVASEIQKMAQNSTESADEIARQLQTIRSSVQTVTTTSSQVAAFTEQFSASMKELDEAYKNIGLHASELLNLSE
ncbi:MAG: methyl-accepting chemotaxis protein [Caryophanon sp.]|nr:methyl-accepting chemotaxis protein [Caryophanon sp.]